jgi:hypothetical protein
MCAIPFRRTDGFGRNMVPWLNIIVTCLKIGHTWAILEGLGEPFGTSQFRQRREHTE